MRINLYLLSICALAAVLPTQIRSFDAMDIVRIHSKVCFESWAKLWYLCRAVDFVGSGSVELSLLEVCLFFNCAPSTVYEWLRSGREQQGFRSYSRRGDRLKIWLGSLASVSLRLGLGRDWGAVAKVPISHLLELKAHAAAVSTQRLQEQSRYAARRSLRKKERQFWKLPTAQAIIEQASKSSDKPAQGEIPCLIWCGKRVVFVSRGFIPFGCSQQGVGKEIGRSDRQLRRYLSQLEVESRQLAQTKTAYGLIDAGCRLGANHGTYAEQDVHYTRLTDDWIFPDDKIKLFERNGRTSSQKKDGHTVTKGRFIRAFGKVWLLRNNIYDLNYCLCNQKQALRRYKNLITRNASTPITKTNEVRFMGGIDM